MNNKLVINVVENYSFRKLYQSDFVNELKARLVQENALSNNKNIELNITSCRVGYPATPHFIDFFLEHLSRQEGEKNLTIKMGCVSYFEWVCLNIIVLEGTFFNMNDKINSEEELNKNRSIINEKLKLNKITLNVILNNAEKTEFKYGYNE